jgi:NADPH:quinone reductase-like Zn-dependent oxidoreductase
MAASQSPTLPPVMIGWTFSRGPYQKVLKLSKNIPTPPPPSKSNILIRVSYAALNPAGPLMISLLPSFILPKYPIPELDFSGTIIQTGPLVAARFKPNTKVFGCLTPVKTVLSGKGALAEYIVLNEKIAGISVVPENVPMDEAAGLGSVGQTAVKTCQRAGIKEGDKVLVNGASGGVGTMLVQVARAMGASVVVGICSGKNVEFVKEVGADEVRSLLFEDEKR